MGPRSNRPKGEKQSAKAQWLEDRVFEVHTSGHRMVFDSAGLRGPAAMESVLGALGACLGSMLAEILDTMRVPFRDLRILVRGTERKEAPRVFDAIEVEVHLQATDCEKAERALALAESRYCPVSAMLRKGGTNLRVELLVARVTD